MAIAVTAGACLQERDLNIMRKALLPALLATAILVLGVVGGCSDDDSATAPTAGGTGFIKVNLIDAPGDYQQVNVEVIRVEIHRGDEADSNSGWSVISEDTTTVDLLTLTDGNSAVLADSTLPAGTYTQVRLILSENNTVMVDSVLHDLEIPSSQNTGLKLNHTFSISDGALYEFTLDFDVDRSIHQTGNGQYKMKPVIRIVVDQTSGGLMGVVEPVAARAMVWTVAGEDTITAWADTLSGAFKFSMLPAGSYDLNLGETVGAYRDTVLTGQVVTAGQMTDVGTVVLDAE
jgi:hypothetical protein